MFTDSRQYDMFNEDKMFCVVQFLVEQYTQTHDTVQHLLYTINDFILTIMCWAAGEYHFI